jgi:hypothetical protein
MEIHKMSDIINARIPPAIEQKLADYCVKRGVTRTQVVTRALDYYLDKEAGGASPYSLAADLIPPRGAKKRAVKQRARARPQSVPWFARSLTPVRLSRLSIATIDIISRRLTGFSDFAANC